MAQEKPPLINTPGLLWNNGRAAGSRSLAAEATKLVWTGRAQAWNWQEQRDSGCIRRDALLDVGDLIRQTRLTQTLSAVSEEAGPPGYHQGMASLSVRQTCMWTVF